LSRLLLLLQCCCSHRCGRNDNKNHVNRRAKVSTTRTPRGCQPCGEPPAGAVSAASGRIVQY
jgi:hypothetical protein